MWFTAVDDGFEGLRESLIAQHTKVDLSEGLLPFIRDKFCDPERPRKAKKWGKSSHLNVHEKRLATRGGGPRTLRSWARWTPPGPCWEREPWVGRGGSLRRRKPACTNFFMYNFDVFSMFRRHGGWAPPHGMGQTSVCSQPVPCRSFARRSPRWFLPQSGAPHPETPQNSVFWCFLGGFLG